MASWNVFSQGKMPDARFDHHTSHLRRTDHNLWTDLDAGIGSDIYNSSGAVGPLRVFLNETFWNIQGQKSTGSDPDASSENNNFIGVARENLRTAPHLGKNPFVERIPVATIAPRNLYWAQMKLLHGITPSIVDSVPGATGINAPYYAGPGESGIPFSIHQKGSGIFLANPSSHRLDLNIYDFRGHCVFTKTVGAGVPDLEINPAEHSLGKGVYWVQARYKGFDEAGPPSPLLLF